MSRLLIVGYGYLGEAIDRCFSNDGWEVVRVGRSASDNVEVADVSDRQSLLELSERIGSVDCIVHCASSGRGGVDAYHSVFLDGVKNLTSVFPGVKLLFTSSSSVYAQVGGEIVTESCEANPNRETGQILLLAEKYVVDHGGVAMRLSGIYGDGRSVILKKFLKGESAIEEDGRRMLNQIHRDDAAEAYLLVAKHNFSGEVFNVSEVKPKSQLETLSWLAEKFERPLPPVVARDLNRKRGWTHKTVSSMKLVAEGWRPRYPSFTDSVDSILESIELT